MTTKIGLSCSFKSDFIFSIMLNFQKKKYKHPYTQRSSLVVHVTSIFHSWRKIGEKLAFYLLFNSNRKLIWKIYKSNLCGHSGFLFKVNIKLQVELWWKLTTPKRDYVECLPTCHRVTKSHHRGLNWSISLEGRKS